MAPPPVAVPTLEPLAAPQTEAERKERQRLHVKRTYYKKLNTMQSQRDQVRQLEFEYARLVVQRSNNERELAAMQHTNNFSGANANANANANSSVISPTGADFFNANNNVCADLFTTGFADANVLFGMDVGENTNFAASNNSLVSDIHESVSVADLKPTYDRYAQLSKVKEQLHAQKKLLRRSIAEFERLSVTLASYMKTRDTLSVASTIEETSSATVRPKLVAPVSVEVCREFARTSFDEMREYRQNQSFLSTGVSVFGWRDKRMQVDDRVKYSLKKVFSGISPLELSWRGWGVLSSAKSLVNLFSPSIPTKFYPLQDVDNDNKIMFRLMSSPDGSVLVKTVFLVTRFVISTGFVIFIQSISPEVVTPQEKAPDVAEKWVEHCTWLTFEAAGQDGRDCLLEFGGDVQVNPVVTPAKWMLEILFIVLRFEGRVRGPVFSIC